MRFLTSLFICLLAVSCGSSISDNERSEAVILTDSIHSYICPTGCENAAGMEAGPCPVCGKDLVENENYNGFGAESSMDEAPEEQQIQEGDDQNENSTTHS